MSSAWRVAAAFLTCLALVVAALAWLTAAALRIDRAEAAARARAEFEERVQLALWRLDAAAAPLVAQESARPYFEYQPFYSALPISQPPAPGLPPAAGIAPSPLLPGPGPWILLHFQVAPDGSWSSPQSPTGSLRERALAGYTTSDRADLAAQRLAGLEQVGADYLLAELPAKPGDNLAQPPYGSWSRAKPDRATGRADTEFLARAQSSVSNYVVTNNRNALAVHDPELQTEPMTPLWLGDRLLLARRVTVGGQTYVQGCQLGARALANWLVSLQQDLFADARLLPIDASVPLSRRLAALPFRFEPGEALPTGDGPSPALLVALGLGWAAVVLTAVGGGALLAGVVKLSERRAAFLSAVTHELRTPLTTLRLYADLLASGRAPSERRPEYLATLSAEAERLGRLVENVLSFARLEGRAPAPHTHSVAIEDLLRQTLPRAHERARQAGLEIAVRMNSADESTFVRCDPAAVEQILFNLVDNACKHGAGSAGRPLELTVARRGTLIRLALRDHGVGVPERLRGRLFRPFSRSAEEAAGGPPGVGLGLALSRRLARQQRGDLRMEPVAGAGACFALLLQLEKRRRSTGESTAQA